MWPTLPCTTMSMPFIEMPQREDALPLITSNPPCPVAPAYWLASPSITTRPDIMFSATPGPAEPATLTVACAFMPAQFANAANPDTYVQTLGPELWEQMDGKIDVFVAGAGSGGTFMGTSRYLKAQNQEIKTVIVEPEGSILNGGESGPHKTEGIGMELIPPFMDTQYFEAIHTITDKEAFAAVSELAQNEGLLVGSSSGAAFVAALREAQSAKPGSHIATVFADSSERYLSQDIYGALFEEEPQ